MEKEEAEMVSSLPSIVQDSRTIPFELHNESNFKIPIIILDVNGEKAGFMVDTGSNGSILDYKWYKEHENLFTLRKKSYIDYLGISGVSRIKTVYLDGIVDGASISFTTSDLSAIRKSLEKHGLSIVGILGSVYLEENNYVIDYKTQSIYIKSN